MGSSSRKSRKRCQPDDLVVFKKLSQFNNVEGIEIPERAENRVPTDRKYLFVFGLAFLLLLPFLAYTLYYSDIARYWGYDQCGNICGKKNAKWDEWNCTGRDFTFQKLLQYENRIINLDTNQSDAWLVKFRQCVSQCDSGYIKVLEKFCLKPNYRRNADLTISDNTKAEWSLELSAYLKSVAWRLTLACSLSLGVAMSMLYLFRTATAAMVWSLLVVVATMGIILVVAVWYGFFWILQEHEYLLWMLWLPLLLTIGLLSLVSVIFFLRKKIALFIALLKEAMKVTFNIPQLMLIPVVTVFVNLIVLVLFVTIWVFMKSAGVLTELANGFLVYDLNIAMNFTKIFSFWMAFWILQFVSGIQYMVIAGAVSKWYFSRDKAHLNNPIPRSVLITFKFHLGNVAFGSMLITIMTFVRSILSSVFKIETIRIEIVMSPIEDFLKYLSKTSYISTAMHGKPFYKSGMRAAQIIFHNVADIVVINSIGDFIVLMAWLLVMIFSLFFTYIIMQGVESEYNWSVYLIVTIVSLIVAAVSFGVFETVIDTIFLCYCEDSLMNDGMARPYAMSRDLMQFVEESKKIYRKKK